MPLLYTNTTIDPVLQLRFLAVSSLAVALVTGFGIQVMRSQATLSVNRAEAVVLGCFLGYVAAIATSLGVAGRTPDGTYELLKTTVAGLLIFASSRAVDGDRRNVTVLARLVIAASFLVGGFAILQYYEVALFEWMKIDTTVDSSMAHRNLLASFLILAFPFVLYGALEFAGAWRVGSAVAMLISLFLFVTLQSRSAWVALAGGGVLTLLAVAVIAKRAQIADAGAGVYRRRAIGAAVLAAVGVGIAALAYSPASRAPMLDHVGSLVQLEHASISERVQLWNRTLSMLKDHPITGVGPGNWRVVLPTYGTDGLRSASGTLHFQRPHNDFLWIASETGILGALLYVAFFAGVLGFTALNIARAPSWHDRMLLALMFFGVTCYVVVSLFSFPKERMAHAVYLALLVGTALSFHRNGEGQRAAASVPRAGTLAIVALAFVATLFAARVALARFEAETHLRRALQARAVRDWPAMVAHLDQIDLRFYVMDPSSAPVAWYRGVARFEMGDTAGALVDFELARRAHPNHVHVLNNIATCQVLLGRPDEAITLYQEVLKMTQKFHEARTNLGALLHSQGRDREAYEALQPFADEVNTPRFQECLRQVKVALGLEI